MNAVGQFQCRPVSYRPKLDNLSPESGGSLALPPPSCGLGLPWIMCRKGLA